MGITYLVGKISPSNFFFQGPGRLSEMTGLAPQDRAYENPLVSLNKTGY